MEQGRRPSIADHGLIGNCRTAALVNRFGSMDWCCFSRFDSPSIFASILSQELGGHFVIQPVGEFQSRQRYQDDTNILETTFESKTGSALLSDCFTLDGDQPKIVPQHEILRIVRGKTGEMRLKIELVARNDYGDKSVRLKRIGNWGLEFSHGRKLLLLQSDLPASDFELDEAGAHLEFSIRSGQTIAFSLIYSDTAPAALPAMGRLASVRESETAEYWRGWISRCSYRGVHEKEVRRSALALKLLAFAPSGAIVAAPTTSLPEWPGAERNWDYRYCWLRDAAFTVRSLASLGYFDEAKSYLNWLMHATRLTHPKLQIVYSVYGESRLHEKTLPKMSGYQGSKPVRVGNEAWNQLQLDVYGEVLDAAHFLLPHFGTIDRETKKFLLGLGKTVAEIWNEPDDGIWEVRSGRSQHTHSKVMAWVALDRVRALAADHGWSVPNGIDGIREKIRETIERYGFDERQAAYTRSFGAPELDASLLVMPLVGFLRADAPRFESTVQAIQKNLTRSGLVYRYAPATDGLGSHEGAFLICSFWLVEALAKAGKYQEANQAMRAVLDRMNGVGLLSEEMNPDTGEYLGNYPQGFSHIGLINAAITVADQQKNHRRTA